MSACNRVRTLAASVIVLAAGAMSVGSAAAFDIVDWNWYKNKYQTETITVNVRVDATSTGLVELEKLQIFFGDVTAKVETSYVTNNQYDAGGSWRSIYTCFCYGQVWVPNSIDAVTNLPSVTTAASAFGNLQVISADVPVFLHDGQFVADTAEYANPLGALAFAALLNHAGDGLGNLHTDLAKAFLTGVVFNAFDPAEITAEARTSHIVNASVDNAATAAANLTQVTVASDVPGNHIVQADMTQFGYADVSATANVNGVSVGNYANLGLIDRPLVSNVATAIGNGVIVNVGPVVH